MTAPPNRRSLRIAVTGASGLVGRRLTAFLTEAGHEVWVLVRRQGPPRPNEIPWDPAAGSVDSERLEGMHAVVHLAGRSIRAPRWTRRVKDEIRRSRVEGTTLLCETLARLTKRPEVLISASAIGYYGDRAEELLTEDGEPGEGFLAGVCREWEAATESAAKAGIRVVRLRLGLVLAGEGGALPAMLPPFRLGLGGAVGDGSQYLSWIALSDVVRAIHHLLVSDVPGPVNATSPAPVTNAEFTRTLGAVLRRPTCLRVPAFVVRHFLGDMGCELLLSSARVVPARLQRSGFTFEFAELKDALRHELGMASE
jgi:uncharacterized protein (TIGR01777 family)